MHCEGRVHSKGPERLFIMPTLECLLHKWTHCIEGPIDQDSSTTASLSSSLPSLLALFPHPSSSCSSSSSVTARWRQGAEKTNFSR